MTVDLTESRLERLREGGKRALAEALALVEAASSETVTIDLLDAAYHGAKGHVIGITGPPGVGKSTLIAALIKAYRGYDETVGVIAVDPSSRRSGGALLGDRVRIDTDPEDQGVFIRSMAARDRLGGLAPMTVAAVVLMRAVYDRVIIETVGVGQSETDIASVADTVLLCVQPGSGDSLQYMKAGIAEIPDLAVVTKADLGKVAYQAKRDLQSAMTTTGVATGARSVWQVPVLTTAASDHESIAPLMEALDKHRRYLGTDQLAGNRHRQAEAWLLDAVRDAHGREGLKVALGCPDGPELKRGASPFRQIEAVLSSLQRR